MRLSFQSPLRGDNPSDPSLLLIITPGDNNTQNASNSTTATVVRGSLSHWRGTAAFLLTECAAALKAAFSSRFMRHLSGILWRSSSSWLPRQLLRDPVLELPSPSLGLPGLPELLSEMGLQYLLCSLLKAWWKPRSSLPEDASLGAALWP